MAGKGKHTLNFHPHIRERAHTRHTHETPQRVVVLCEFILWTQSEYTYKIIGDLMKEKGLKNREEKRKKGIFGGGKKEKRDKNSG